MKNRYQTIFPCAICRYRTNFCLLLVLFLCFAGSTAEAQSPDSPEKIYTEMTHLLHKLPGNSCEYHLHVVMGLDVSGSMSGTLRTSFFAAWDRLLDYFFQPGDTFTVIPFDKIVLPAQEKAFSNTGEMQGWFKHIAGSGGDGTCFYKAQKAVLEKAEVVRKKRKSKFVTLALVITDTTERNLSGKEGENDRQAYGAVETLAAHLSQNPDIHNMTNHPFNLQDSKGGPLYLQLYYLSEGNPTAQKTEGTVERSQQIASGEDPLGKITHPDEAKPEPGWNGAELVFGIVLLLTGIVLTALGLKQIANLKTKVTLTVGRDNVLSGDGTRLLDMDAKTTFTLLAGSHDAKDAENEWRINIPGASEDRRPLLTLRLIDYPHYECEVKPHKNALLFASDETQPNAVFIKNGETAENLTLLKVGLERNGLATVRIKPHSWKEGKQRQFKSLLAFAGPGLFVFLLGGLLCLGSRPHPAETTPPEKNQLYQFQSDRESLCK